jgi:hypothetical protein
MKLYLVDGEDLVHRVGPFQTLIVLAPDEPAVRDVLRREAKGFRIDRIELIREYPQPKGDSARGDRQDQLPYTDARLTALPNPNQSSAGDSGASGQPDKRPRV